jgi:hypothetical protein
MPSRGDFGVFAAAFAFDGADAFAAFAGGAFVEGV